MQSHPSTRLLIAHTRVADRLREAESVRLADLAAAHVSAPGGGLGRRLACTLRAAAIRAQRSVADLPIFAYR